MPIPFAPAYLQAAAAKASAAAVGGGSVEAGQATMGSSSREAAVESEASAAPQDVVRQLEGGAEAEAATAAVAAAGAAEPEPQYADDFEEEMPPVVQDDTLIAEVRIQNTHLTKFKVWRPISM